MEVAEIRAKCLELAHRPDLLPDEVIKRAGAYEAYVLGAAKAETPDNPLPKRGPGRPPGKTGKR